MVCLGRCPSHSRERFMSLTVIISWFSHCSLVFLEVILSSHCLMLMIPSTVQMQRWWNVLSRFRCFLSRIQHSPPYCSTESKQTLYTCLLVVREKLVFVKTAFHKALNALEALARHLSTSASIQPSAAIIDPRYWNSFTYSMLPPSAVIGNISKSCTLWPTTKNFVLETFTVSPNFSASKYYAWIAVSAAACVVASSATSSANSHLCSVSSQAFLVYHLKSRWSGL